MTVVTTVVQWCVPQQVMGGVSHEIVPLKDALEPPQFDQVLVFVLYALGS